MELLVGVCMLQRCRKRTCALLPHRTPLEFKEAPNNLCVGVQIMGARVTVDVMVCGERVWTSVKNNGMAVSSFIFYFHPLPMLHIWHFLHISCRKAHDFLLCDRCASVNASPWAAPQHKSEIFLWDIHPKRVQKLESEAEFVSQLCSQSRLNLKCINFACLHLPSFFLLSWKTIPNK